MLIALYTYVFHSYYPLLENKPLSWTEALLVCGRIDDNRGIWLAAPVFQ